MSKPYKFNLTKDRSAINGKYTFEFIGNSQRAVVPVLQHTQLDEYRIVGTASYFIQPNIFITAAHIFKGPDINDDDGFSIFLDGAQEPTPIFPLFRDESLDLAVVKLECASSEYLNGIDPLTVMNLPPEQFEVVASFGYSHSRADPTINPSEIYEKNDGSFEQHLNFKTKWELGGILEIHNSGRGHIKGQVYETSILVEGRDSGAPMFNSNGFFVGIASMSMQFDEGLPNSIFASITQMDNYPINGKSIKDLVNRKNRAAFCKPIVPQNSRADKS